MSWQLCTCKSMSEFKSVYNAVSDYFAQGKAVDIQIREHQENRKNAQNALQWHWFQELEMQGDMSANEYRRMCKLHFGVPIAREDENFRQIYDKSIRPLAYEEKLLAMAEPFDLPVTRNFTIANMKRYLDEIQKWAVGEGFRLTTSESLYWEAMGKAA